MNGQRVGRRSLLAGVAAGLVSERLLAGGETSESASPPREAGAARGTYDGTDHTLGLFDHIPREFAFRAETVGEFNVWQNHLRARLRDVLGVSHMEREVEFAFRAERADRQTKDGYVQEKWYLWTEPDVPLPIWVLIPDKPAARPYPLVLTPHGHNEPEVYIGVAKDEAARKSIAEGQRDIAVQAARQGYLAVLPTARGFGETKRNDDAHLKKIHSCRTELMHQMLFGRTPVGCRVWDISRIIDWVSREHEIDAKRIAITGNSGGGTTSVFAPACDPRITVAVPSCYFCTFRDSIGSIYHCECNYVPGLLRLAEMWEVAGLIAPRAFCAIAGRTDTIFPVEAVKTAYERLRAIYQVAGAADRCDLFIGEGGHRYYSDGSWPFIRRQFGC